MKWYIVKDGHIEAETATKENALKLIEYYKKRTNTHYMVNSEYYLIHGTIDFNLK